MGSTGLCINQKDQKKKLASSLSVSTFPINKEASFINSLHSSNNTFSTVFSEFSAAGLDSQEMINREIVKKLKNHN